MVDAPLYSVYLTKTAVYGLTMSHDRDDFWFFWNKGEGLVLLRAEPERYERLVAGAGPANEGYGPGSYGPGIFYMEYAARPVYGKQWCQTRLMAW